MTALHTSLGFTVMTLMSFISISFFAICQFVFYSVIFETETCNRSSGRPRRRTSMSKCSQLYSAIAGEATNGWFTHATSTGRATICDWRPKATDVHTGRDCMPVTGSRETGESRPDFVISENSGDQRRSPDHHQLSEQNKPSTPHLFFSFVVAKRFQQRPGV